jgi:phenylalanyl-tRNA synthetase beta chain
MNIKITHSWLLDYLDTDATPLEIQKYLSLCGPSVERIEELNGDAVYDIEITSNRIDTASVLGIAREAAAILPMFGKKAKLKKKVFVAPPVPSSSVPISITDPEGVCRRLLGIVMEVKGVEPAPGYMSKRVLATDTRSINNVVDVTNYVMTEIGHPCHVFDYDRITTHKLILRHAKNAEEIITLDEKTYHLDEKDIIIDDGTGKVIDLPGIMGTANSVVTDDTKRILFFIESNDPVAIRRTSMKYGIRTMASTINEKNPDSELAYTAFLRGIELFKEIADAKPLSAIIDIYPKKPQTIKIQTSKSFIDVKAGVAIPLKTIESILTNLDFEVEVSGDDELTITVPTHRLADVSIPEDIVEEVTRVYGYFAIPSVLQVPAYVQQPKDTENLFHYQYEVKSLLKHKGFAEVMNYSACSGALLKAFDQKEQNYLHITNSISEDIKFLRQSLIPSLVQNSKQNEGFAGDMRIFEIAKTYIPEKSNLPNEEFKLTILVNTSFDDLKQTIITLMDDLNIEAGLEQGKGNPYLLNTVQGEVKNDKEQFGFYGQVTPAYCRNVGLEKPIYAVELYFERLMKAARRMPVYKAFSSYAHITHDLTIVKKEPYSTIKKRAFSASTKLISLRLLSTYKDTITLRLEFTDNSKNLTEDEVKEEVKKIQSKLS